MRLLTFEEMHYHGCGLLRLGLASDARRDGTLIPWSEIWQDAGIAPEVKSSLDREGIRRGSAPNDWYCSFDSVPLKNLVIEYMGRNNSTWVRMAAPDDVAQMLVEIKEQVAEEKERRNQ